MQKELLAAGWELCGTLDDHWNEYAEELIDTLDDEFQLYRFENHREIRNVLFDTIADCIFDAGNWKEKIEKVLAVNA